MAHLGELLAELRQDRGLTQDQLAEIISVSPGTISNYEDGRHLPDLDKLKMIADYFHVTTDYLLGRTSSSIPIDLLQKRLADGKTVSDLISIFPAALSRPSTCAAAHPFGYGSSPFCNQSMRPEGSMMFFYSPSHPSNRR